MRRRVLWVTMTSVVLAIVVLGLPLALTVRHIVGTDERRELERIALRAAVGVTTGNRSGTPVDLPKTEASIDLGVYDPSGRRIAGDGPARLEDSSLRAISGSIAESSVDEQTVEAVPVTRAERVIAIVRAASPESAVSARTLQWDLVLLAGCLFAAGCAAALAAWQSRRLARPLVNLSGTAGELGAGNFSVRSVPCGVREIDAVGEALNRTAERLSDLIGRERSFSTHASHQLRTPLTQLQLELESGLDRGGDALRAAATAAMSTVDRLSQTIDDVLDLARGAEQVVGYGVEELLGAVEQAWHGPLAAQGRALRIVCDQALRVGGSLSAARQILHVLLDNAMRHGRGTVTVHARDSHGAVAVDVVDEGVAEPISLSGHGRLGLSLAQSLAAAEHGRLLIDQQGSGTRFTLLLPAERERVAPVNQT